MKSLQNQPNVHCFKNQNLEFFHINNLTYFYLLLPSSIYLSKFTNEYGYPLYNSYQTLCLESKNLEGY